MGIWPTCTCTPTARRLRLGRPRGQTSCSRRPLPRQAGTCSTWTSRSTGRSIPRPSCSTPAQTAAPKERTGSPGMSSTTTSMRKATTLTTDNPSTECNLTGGELRNGGMTCGSRENRVEKQLNALDGGAARVSYATEKASVTAPEGYGPQLLIAEVEKTGYSAELPPS